MSRLDKFAIWAKENGWNVQSAQTNETLLPESVIGRYIIPDECYAFLAAFSVFENAGKSKWFLCAEDYGEKPEDEFRWNEFELISLEAAKKDEIWRNDIRKFWDSHFPFFMSVESGYSYYAINLNSGEIVRGDEPEFEETVTVADSFAVFLEKIVSGELDL